MDSRDDDDNDDEEGQHAQRTPEISRTVECKYCHLEFLAICPNCSPSVHSQSPSVLSSQSPIGRNHSLPSTDIQALNVSFGNNNNNGKASPATSYSSSDSEFGDFMPATPPPTDKLKTGSKVPQHSALPQTKLADNQKLTVPSQGRQILLQKSNTKSDNKPTTPTTLSAATTTTATTNRFIEDDQIAGPSHQRQQQHQKQQKQPQPQRQQEQQKSAKTVNIYSRPIVLCTTGVSGNELSTIEHNLPLMCATSSSPFLITSVTRTYTMDVTHLVVKQISTEPRLIQYSTVYYLALSEDKIMVDYEWIEECMLTGEMVSQTPYLLSEFSKAQVSDEVNNFSAKNIFTGGSFYCDCRTRGQLTEAPTGFTVETLKQLIRNMGGTVLEGGLFFATETVILLVDNAIPTQSGTQWFKKKKEKGELIVIYWPWVIRCLENGKPVRLDKYDLI